MPRDDSLIGHWSLTVVASDATVNGNDGLVHGVIFANGAARFDAPGANIEVPHTSKLSLGAIGDVGWRESACRRS